VVEGETMYKFFYLREPQVVCEELLNDIKCYPITDKNKEEVYSLSKQLKAVLTMEDMNYARLTKAEKGRRLEAETVRQKAERDVAVPVEPVLEVKPKKSVKKASNEHEEVELL
jgi:PHD/YefM family antitoxin component YafN of YafNO toxin-antitoxin module